MGLPGILEIVIVVVAGLIVFVIPVAILLAILFVLKSQSRPGPFAAAQCPACQTPVVCNAEYCSACGEKLPKAKMPSVTN